MSIFFPSSSVGLDVELPFSLLQVRDSNPHALSLILRTLMLWPALLTRLCQILAASYLLYCILFPHWMSARVL